MVAQICQGAASADGARGANGGAEGDCQGTGQPIPEVGDLSKYEPFHEVGGPHPLSLIHDVPGTPRCKEKQGATHRLASGGTVNAGRHTNQRVAKLCFVLQVMSVLKVCVWGGCGEQGSQSIAQPLNHT